MGQRGDRTAGTCPYLIAPRPCPPIPARKATGPARGPSSLLTSETEMVVHLSDGCWGPTKTWYVVVT